MLTPRSIYKGGQSLGLSGHGSTYIVGASGHLRGEYNTYAPHYVAGTLNAVCHTSDACFASTGTVNQSRPLPQLSVTKYVIAPPHTHAHAMAARHNNTIKGSLDPLFLENLSNCVQCPHTHATLIHTD